jgi:tetrahydromethanopterin S-methyltransferase subunit C
MTDDALLADLLGEAPRTPDPGFRIDVLARVTQRRQRRAAMLRAAKLIAVSAGLGLVFPVAAAAGMTLADIQPLLISSGVIALGYLVAQAAIEGPLAALTRSWALLRVRF